MATALIQSLVNGINPVVGASRDDLRAGDVVQLDQVGGPATTYAWSIAFAPEDKDRNPSAAVLVGNVFGPGPVTFTVDNEGPYLIRLVIDAGLPTQDEQYVRLRYDTFFGDLKLVAAGERRDGSGIIPVDISAEGWANDQNFNLNRLLCLVQHVSASGRIIYVDANRGKDNLQAPNDPAVAEGFADFSTISEAILAANTNAEFNGGILPSATQPMIVAVRPGLYQEDIEFTPYVHVIGWPSSGGGTGEHPDFDRSVNIRAANGAGPPALTFTANMPNLGEYAYISNVILENVGATTNALLRKIGDGDVYLVNCELLQNGGGAPSQGSGISVERGRAFLDNTRVVQTDTFSHESTAFIVSAAAGTAALITKDSMFIGPSIGQVNPTQLGGVTAFFKGTKFQQVQNAGAGTEFAIQSWSEDLILEDCELVVDSASAITEALEINADAAGTPGDLSLTLRRTLLGDTTTGAPGFLGFTIDSTGVTGTAYLRMASSEYGTITQVGAVTRQALTIGTSLFYDNTASGLVSENVQDAIDEIAGGGGGGAAPSTASFVTWQADGTLSDNRVLTGGTGITVPPPGGGGDSPVTVNITATGVAAGSYTRTDLTVNAQGQLTLAASGVVEETYSRQMLVPTPPAVIAPPLVVQEFDVINSATGFTVPTAVDGPPGAPGPLQVFWAVGGPFAAGTFLQVYLAPFGGPITPIINPAGGAGYSPSGYDLATLGGPIPAGVPVGAFIVKPLAVIPAGYVVPPGVPHMLLFEVTHPALQPAGTDGLTVSLTGSV